MSRTIIVRAAVVGAILCGCGDDSPSELPSATPATPARAERGGPRPMPTLSARAERVLLDLGEDAADVLAAIEVVDGRLTTPRREALRAIGPRGRAALRRHNVRIQELARHLEETP